MQLILYLESLEKQTALQSSFILRSNKNCFVLAEATTIYPSSLNNAKYCPQEDNTN